MSCSPPWLSSAPGVFVAAEAVADHADERTGALAVAIPVATLLIGLALMMLLTGSAPDHRSVWSSSPERRRSWGSVYSPTALAAAGCAAVIVVLVSMMALLSRVRCRRRLPSSPAPGLRRVPLGLRR